MANYSIKTDLLKVKGAFTANIKGKASTKRCLCIPIDEDSGLFLGEKGVYLNLTAIELQNPKYADTHLVKVSYDKDRYEAMTKQEREALPIVGNLRPIERTTTPMPITNEATIEQDDDLPF